MKFRPALGGVGAVALVVPVAGPASAAATSPAGLAFAYGHRGAIEYGYRYVSQAPTRLTGPMELGSILDFVDLTIGGFSCTADEPFVDPVCATHTVPVSGTAQRHPSAAEPAPQRHPVTGTCRMPTTVDVSTAWVSCVLHIGSGPDALGMTVRIDTARAGGTAGVLDPCTVSAPTACDPLPGASAPYDGVYQQR